jgi:hypothetical protein
MTENLMHDDGLSDDERRILIVDRLDYWAGDVTDAWEEAGISYRCYCTSSLFVAYVIDDWDRLGEATAIQEEHRRVGDAE